MSDLSYSCTPSHHTPTRWPSRMITKWCHSAGFAGAGTSVKSPVGFQCPRSRLAQFWSLYRNWMIWLSVWVLPMEIIVGKPFATGVALVFAHRLTV